MHLLDEVTAVTKELYLYSLQEENQYLEDKTLTILMKLKSLDSIITNDDNEIQKVKRKVPKWMLKRNQLNYRILDTYMLLTNNNEKSINILEFKNHCSIDEKLFATNYLGMKSISAKNHAKVFEEKRNKVTLWSPISDFIVALFQEHRFRRWSKESGGLKHDYVIENYVKALTVYIPENLKEYSIEPYFENIFLCTNIEILNKFHKMYLSGGELKEQEKNKNLPSSISKYIQFLEDNKESNTHE